MEGAAHWPQHLLEQCGTMEAANVEQGRSNVGFLISVKCVSVNDDVSRRRTRRKHANDFSSTPSICSTQSPNPPLDFQDHGWKVTEAKQVPQNNQMDLFYLS